MYRCDLFITIVQRKNKTKHNQSKKHKYYSNLILNRYVIKNVEVIKIKDVFNPYIIEHTIKITFFTVHITLRPFESEDILNHKINVAKYVTFNFQSEHYTTYITDLANNFLHRVTSSYFSLKIIPEIEIVFI